MGLLLEPACFSIDVFENGASFEQIFDDSVTVLCCIGWVCTTYLMTLRGEENSFSSNVLCLTIFAIETQEVLVNRSLCW